MYIMHVILVLLSHFNYPQDSWCTLFQRDVIYKYQYQQHAQKCPLIDVVMTTG